VVNEQVRIAAIDVDGTLVDGQTQALLVRHLLARRMLTLPVALSVGIWFTRYRLGFSVDHVGIRRRVFAQLAGMSISDVAGLVDAVFTDAIRGRVRSLAVEEIKRLRAEGVEVVLVSASVEPLITRIARAVGVSHVIATRLVVARGRLTGELDGAVIEGNGKLDAFRNWANGQFGRWELTDAYGDHVSDVPLLEVAQRAWAVCPDAALKSEAQRRGWKCLNWRETDAPAR
jgi:HAD superfamily hydrolase (TIGR01490 family)